MKMKQKLAIGLAISFLCSATCVMAENDKSVTYKNQRGSIMVLSWHPGKSEAGTGTLTGSFTTAVGNCQKDVGVALPLTGYFNGNAIGITVNFPHCKQVVAMTGYLVNNGDGIHTIWLDAQQAADPMRNDWNSNLIGNDEYKKQ